MRSSLTVRLLRALSFESRQSTTLLELQAADFDTSRERASSFEEKGPRSPQYAGVAATTPTIAVTTLSRSKSPFQTKKRVVHRKLS